MPRKVLAPYECPKCGLKTKHRMSMHRHLYELTKDCCGIVRQMELTDEIKLIIMNDRIYHFPAVVAPSQHTHINVPDQSQPQKASTHRQKIPKKVRIETWSRYIGMEIGKAPCMCCEKEDMTQMTFHCGHVVSHADGGSMNIDNLRPICASCNLSMHTQNMNEFRLQFFGLGEVRGGVVQ